MHSSHMHSMTEANHWSLDRTEILFLFSKAKKAESSPNVEPSDEGNSRGHSAGEWMLRKLQQVQGGMESVIWVSILFRSDPEIHVPNLPQGNTLLSVGISWMCLINCGLMCLQTKGSVELSHKAIFILPAAPTSVSVLRKTDSVACS